MITPWDRWHRHFAGIVSRGWLDRKSLDVVSGNPFVSVREGEVSGKAVFRSQLNPVQVEYLLPQNTEIVYKTWELWNKLPESQISKHVSLPCVLFANSQPAACVLLVLLLLLGTFWNSRWVGELRYEGAYFKNKLIIFFFCTKCLLFRDFKVLSFLWFVL